ncbi:MAG: hypothetical protein HYV63_29450 [Candidatus Schekmanbacteria bacterium]|nr:hypothetical protein [Candidatus Schekmanbacteria bacterium]
MRSHAFDTFRLRAMFGSLQIVGFVALLALATLAHGGEWQAIGPNDPQDNGITSIAGAIGNAVYINTYCCTYRSTDNGQSWTFLATRNSTFVSPTGQLFIAAYDTIATSADGGTTWVPVATTPAPCGEFDRSGTGTLHAACGDIFRSTDSGITWQDVYQDPSSYYSFREIVADPSTGSVALAQTSTTMFRSKDDGLTWNEVIGGAVLRDVTFFRDGHTVVASRYAEGVYQSSDAGMTWSLVVAALAPSDLYRHPNTDELFALIGGSIHASGDQGRSWHPYPSGPPTTDVISLGIDPASNAWYATTSHAQGNFWYSTNGGVSWNSANTVSTPTVHELAAPGPSPTAIFAAADDLGVWRYDGNTWQNVTSNLPSKYSSGIAASKTDPNTVYLSHEEGTYRTSDAGASWQQVLQYRAEELTVTKQDTLLVNVYGAIKRSTDHGTTWTEVFGSVTVGGFGYDTRSDNVVYFTTYDAMNRSTDDGATWQTIPLPFFNNQTVAGTTGLLIVGANEGILRSTDEGVTWTEIEDSPRNIIKILIDPGTDDLYAGGYWPGILVSRDAGVTWKPSGVTVASIAVRDFLLADDTLYAGTVYGGVMAKSLLPPVPLLGRPSSMLLLLLGVCLAGRRGRRPVRT